MNEKINNGFKYIISWVWLKKLLKTYHANINLLIVLCTLIFRSIFILWKSNFPLNQVCYNIGKIYYFIKWVYKRHCILFSGICVDYFWFVKNRLSIRPFIVDLSLKTLSVSLHLKIFFLTSYWKIYNEDILTGFLKII